MAGEPTFPGVVQVGIGADLRLECCRCGERWVPIRTRNGDHTDHSLDKSVLRHWKVCEGPNA